MNRQGSPFPCARGSASSGRKREQPSIAWCNAGELQALPADRDAADCYENHDTRQAPQTRPRRPVSRSQDFASPWRHLLTLPPFAGHSWPDTMLRHIACDRAQHLANPQQPSWPQRGRVTWKITFCGGVVVCGLAALRCSIVGHLVQVGRLVGLSGRRMAVVVSLSAGTLPGLAGVYRRSVVP